MELIDKKDALHAVLHNQGQAAVAAVENIKAIKLPDDFMTRNGKSISFAELEKQIPKEGEWIPSMYTYADGTTEHDKDEWYGELYECSICHYVMIGEENYCPNCGARMRKGE